MDYSKQGGGTRILDQAKARTLATGTGKSFSEIRELGSKRMNRVIDGIKPGALVADTGIAPHVQKRDAQAEVMKQLNMEPVMSGVKDKDVTGHWPVISGSTSHQEANGMCGGPACGKDDQGERERVPTTGRHPSSVHMIQGSLSRSGV